MAGLGMAPGVPETREKQHGPRLDTGTTLFAPWGRAPGHVDKSMDAPQVTGHGPPGAWGCKEGDPRAWKAVPPAPPQRPCEGSQRRTGPGAGSGCTCSVLGKTQTAWGAAGGHSRNPTWADVVDAGAELPNRPPQYTSFQCCSPRPCSSTQANPGGGGSVKVPGRAVPGPVQARAQGLLHPFVPIGYARVSKWSSGACPVCTPRQPNYSGVRSSVLWRAWAFAAMTFFLWSGTCQCTSPRPYLIQHFQLYGC